MEPKDIVVSLEHAKALKEAGWTGNAHFLWAYHCFDYSNDSELQKPFVTCAELEDHYHQWEMMAAPTASEIIRRIPVADRIAVPADRLDDPNSWAEIYCALQPGHIS